MILAEEWVSGIQLQVVRTDAGYDYLRIGPESHARDIPASAMKRFKSIIDRFDAMIVDKEPELTRFINADRCLD